MAGGIMSPCASVSAWRIFNANDMNDDLDEAAESSESGENLGGLIGFTERTKRSTLSNKERLVLCKQALGMRKHPMVAVGRSNVLTGIVKMIKLHFEKHPLVIVNVKGRAEGTSVRELVFRLEQATGATLVSQETNKRSYSTVAGELKRKLATQKGEQEAGLDRRRMVLATNGIPCLPICWLLPSSSVDFFPVMRNETPPTRPDSY